MLKPILPTLKVSFDFAVLRRDCCTWEILSGKVTLLPPHHRSRVEKCPALICLQKTCTDLIQRREEPQNLILKHWEADTSRLLISKFWEIPSPRVSILVVGMHNKHKNRHGDVSVRVQGVRTALDRTIFMWICLWLMRFSTGIMENQFSDCAWSLPLNKGAAES